MRKHEFISLNMVNVSANIPNWVLTELLESRHWNWVTKKEKKKANEALNDT